MAFETKNPYPQQHRHGNSPSFRGNSPSTHKPNQQRRRGGVMKHNNKKSRQNRPPSTSQPEIKLEASESPASSISQTAASSSVVAAEKADTNTEPTTPNSQ